MSEKTANIKTLYANQEKTEILFPRTKIEAISDNKGTSLKAYLNDAVYAADVDTDIGSTSSPVEADTLGGETPEFYASKNYVDGMKNAIDTNLANNYLDKETIEKIYAQKSYVDKKVADIISGGEIVLDGYVTDQKLQNEVQTLQESINNVNTKAEAAATPEDVLEAKTNAINEAWSYTNQQVKKATPRNLLDNSDFTNPVNQRGQTSYSGRVYGIDRWLGDSADSVITTTENGIIATGAYMVQILEKKHVGKALTICAKDAKGGIAVATCTVQQSTGYSWLCTDVSTNGTFVGILQTDTGVLRANVKNGAGVAIKWAALYEGEYTVETLPEYQPKGYAVELAECRRYYQVLPFKLMTATSETKVLPGREYKVPMRVVPTATIFTPAGDGYIATWGNDTAFTVEAVYTQQDSIVYVTATEQTTVGKPIGYGVKLSADL